MKVFNPTGWDVEAKAAGKKYIIPAFSDLEIYDVYHVQHIINSFENNGIVDLEYGSKAKEDFPSFTEYKKSQEIKGLKNALKYRRQILSYEKAAEAEVKAAGPKGILHQSTLDVKSHEENVKFVEKWLKEAGGELKKVLQEKQIVKDRPKWETSVEEESEEVKMLKSELESMKKRATIAKRGQDKVLNESRGTKNQN